MSESIQDLERHIDALRSDIRRSVVAGDRVSTRDLRARLRRAEQAWEQALAELEPSLTAAPADQSSLLPIREQVHQALTLLGVPAAPRLLVAIHTAFLSGELTSSRLTSVRRDEERSFRAAPYARPYYLCPALTADLLSPARGLLTISTWPVADRIVGPLSPRVQFLTAAIQVADTITRMEQPRPEATRLLWRFAANIPGTDGRPTPAAVAKAARTELVIHDDADRLVRGDAARRTDRLTDAQRLFGARLSAAGDSVATG